jgi:hypothetical protein
MQTQSFRPIARQPVNEPGRFANPEPREFSATDEMLLHRACEALKRARADVAALGVGSVFKGASPAGEAAGYAKGTPIHSMYMHVFIDELHAKFPDGIRVNMDNLIR